MALATVKQPDVAFENVLRLLIFQGQYGKALPPQCVIAVTFVNCYICVIAYVFLICLPDTSMQVLRQTQSYY